MKLSAPTQIVFLIAAVLAVLGIVGHFVNITFVTEHQFWFVVAGWAVLTVGNLMKGV